jgi:hypothetical protein
MELARTVCPATTRRVLPKSGNNNEANVCGRQDLRPFTGVSAAGGNRPVLEHGFAKHFIFPPRIFPCSPPKAAGMEKFGFVSVSYSPGVNAGPKPPPADGLSTALIIADLCVTTRASPRVNLSHPRRFQRCSILLDIQVRAECLQCHAALFVPVFYAILH